MIDAGAYPPPPIPLPRGEGEPFLFPAFRLDSQSVPSPLAGEGQGEGVSSIYVILNIK